TPDQPPPRGEDEKAEGHGGGKGREEEEKEGEARQGVQARACGGEAAARHARVLGGGRGGGLGHRGPRSEGQWGSCGREPPTVLPVGRRRGGAGGGRRDESRGGALGKSLPRGCGAGVIP